MKHVLAVLIALAAAGGLVGCTSNADKVSKNISTEAEKFNVQRRIVGVNGITDKVEFEVIGRCSIDDDPAVSHTLDVVCKRGPNSYTKNFIGLSDNTFFIATQLAPISVSEYHTEIVLKPQNIVPDFDLQTGNTP